MSWPGYMVKLYSLRLPERRQSPAHTVKSPSLALCTSYSLCLKHPLQGCLPLCLSLTTTWNYFVLIIFFNLFAVWHRPLRKAETPLSLSPRSPTARRRLRTATREEHLLAATKESPLNNQDRAQPKKKAMRQLYLKWITKDLLYNPGNSAQCYVAAWMEVGVGGRMDTCICMAESLHCPPEATATLLALWL